MIILIIVLHYVRALTGVERVLRTLINPSSQFLYGVSVTIGNTEERFATPEELIQAYQDAKQHVADLSVDAARTQTMVEENRALRETLQFFASSTVPMTSVGADVIGKNIEPLGSTIVLNKGSLSGIQKGNPVIVGKGIVVGRVMRVEDALSVVQLINDPQSKLAATTLNEDKSIGVVEGGFGISVRMNFIPQNETVHVGDMVMTSGLEQGVPRGLLIGTIEAVEKEAYQPFQRAIITPTTQLDKVSIVSIITAASPL